MMFDVGFEVKLVLLIDVRAIEHILHKQGMGRMKHTDVAQLWWQGQIRSNSEAKKKGVGSGHQKQSVGQQSRGHVETPWMHQHVGQFAEKMRTHELQST